MVTDKELIDYLGRYGLTPGMLNKKERQQAEREIEMDKDPLTERFDSYFDTHAAGIVLRCEGIRPSSKQREESR